MVSKNLNVRQSVSEELTKVTIVCVDTPFLSYFILRILRILSPCSCCAGTSAHVSTKSWCGWHGCYACYAMRASRIHRRATAKRFSLAEKNQIPGYEKLANCSWRQLFSRKKWLFDFSKYSGYLSQVRCTKAFFVPKMFQIGSFLNEIFKKIVFFQTRCTGLLPYCSMAWYVCCSVWISWLSRGQRNTRTRLHSGQMSTYQTDDPHYKCLYSIHRRSIGMLWLRTQMSEAY